MPLTVQHADTFWEGESLISLPFGKVSSLYEHDMFE